MRAIGGRYHEGMLGLRQARKTTRDQRALRDIGRYGSLGFEFVLNMVVGFLLGRWLDKKCGTHFLIWVGSGVGVYAAFRSLVVAARRLQADAERDELDEAARREAARLHHERDVQLKKLEELPERDQEEIPTPEKPINEPKRP